jgi:hypothetical protein
MYNHNVVCRWSIKPSYLATLPVAAKEHLKPFSAVMHCQRVVRRGWASLLEKVVLLF